MASKSTHNHLLRHRKILALSQAELAFLLGVLSGAKVCRHERRLREPTLRAALAYEAVFSEPVSKLFPALFKQVEDCVLVRAAVLLRKRPSGCSKSLAARRKRSLESIVARGRDNPSKPT